ncbi:hypothetical protein PP512_gp53 [Gordonia phage Denise]|uniref:DUF1508 domain-containing protein n=1 Tax=Gordonia phage Denise TaxID=2652879 RepID=A0A5P8DCF1_9CAUD|nr:hypothetical protein PP512_gp53 [Gordonia phage Denise]QFP96668.1 hypothetical protein SEA_DENISE_53 [Gordonia phage Denise]
MIVFEGRPAQYRGTIEVYAEVRVVYDLRPDAEVTKVEWRWRCRSRNNSILASGEGYRRRAGALNAIDAQYAVRFEDDSAGQRWSAAASRRLLPWRLVIRDRHGDIDKIGAVY